MQAADTLITSFKLKDDFSAPFKAMMGSLSGGLSVIGNISASLAGIGAGAGTGLLAFGVAAVQAAADTESLRMGLAAVVGGAAEAETQFARLKDMAKMPGLDLEPLIRGSIALQATGMSARDAERAMREFGNAVATVGDGPAQLSEVLYGLRQLSGASTVLAEDLNIIKERVPQVGAILQRLYGSSRSEDIAALGVNPQELVQRLVAELSLLPRFAGGASNAFVNMAAAWETFKVAIGTPMLPVVTATIERLTGAVDKLESSGVLKKIGDDMARAFGGDAIGDGLLNGLAWVVATLEQVPKIVTEIRNTFAERFDEMRAAVITFAGVVVNFATSTAILSGFRTLVEVFLMLRKAIAMAAAAQAAMLVMTGVGVAAVIAGLAAGAGTMAFLDQAIPKMGRKEDEDMPGRLGDMQRRQRELRKGFDQEMNAGSKGKDKDGLAPSGKKYEWSMKGDKEQTDYLRKIADNTGDQLERRIIGGGSIGAQQFSAVRIGKALDSGGSPVRRAVNDLVEAIEREAYRNFESLVSNRGVPTERR